MTRIGAIAACLALAGVACTTPRPEAPARQTEAPAAPAAASSIGSGGANLVSGPRPSAIPTGIERGGVVQLQLADALEDRNPLSARSRQYTEVAHYVVESLGERDRSDPDRWFASLATRVETDESRTEFHVWLRPGVPWHVPSVDPTDPGLQWTRGPHEVTSDDFVFLGELLRDGRLTTALGTDPVFEDLVAIRAINQHEFVVEWDASFEDTTTATLELAPVPRWLYGVDRDGTPFAADQRSVGFEHHWYNDSMIGTGPFRYAGRTSEGGIRLGSDSRTTGATRRRSTRSSSGSATRTRHTNWRLGVWTCCACRLGGWRS